MHTQKLKGSQIIIETLIEQGCDYIQGFFYAKPMPENQYIEFLKSNA